MNKVDESLIPHQKRARICLEGSLQDFTGQAQVNKTFSLNPSAKDMIESCGVPHVEVFGLIVNRSEKPLSYNVQDGDTLIVFPKKESGQSVNCDNIRKADDLPSQFIADVHLGKLSRYLRLMGIDTLYSNDAADADIVDTAISQQRAALTRDIGLLKYGRLNYGYWLRSTDLDTQLSEVIRFFDLNNHFRPFTRCMNCNGRLDPVSKKAVESDLPPRVKESFEEFRQCRECGQIYWKGTHFEKLVKKVKRIKS